MREIEIEREREKQRRGCPKVLTVALPCSPGGGDVAVMRDDGGLAGCADLLAVDVEQLSQSLVTRRLVARGESYTIMLTPAQARPAASPPPHFRTRMTTCCYPTPSGRRPLFRTRITTCCCSLPQALDSRDALAKSLYSKLFTWLVHRINECTAPRGIDEEHAVPDVHSVIGVLDIFGFESFDYNTLEQLLINFANEKLQQQFTWYVFKLEQEEYDNEGIKWSSIDFQDNQPVLEVLEGYGGVLALLQEACHTLELISARVLGRRTAPFSPFLIPNRVPHGFTHDPSTDHSTHLLPSRDRSAASRRVPTPTT